MIRGVSSGFAAATLVVVACLAPAQDSFAESAPIRGAYLQIESVSVDRGRRWMLYLDGMIESGADQRLAQFVDQQGIAQADVYFNSPGGSLLAGMAIGRFLRERGFDTHVGTRTSNVRRPADGVCYSACPFAYAGGVQRSLRKGSVLGVHRARNRVPLADDEAFERRVQADATRYLLEMGASPQLAELMRKVPAGGIRVLTREEATEFGLVNSGTASRR
jgi:hypothetical protein